MSDTNPMGEGGPKTGKLPGNVRPVTVPATQRAHPTAQVVDGGKVCADPAAPLCARDGAPKQTQVVHDVHSGMTAAQRGPGGRSHSTAGVPAAAPIDATALGSTHPGKLHTVPTRTVGTRHRTIDTLHSGDVGENVFRGELMGGPDHALGERVLDEAYAAGSFHDRLTRRRFKPLTEN